MNMIYWCIIIINLSHQWRWSPKQQLLLVDLCRISRSTCKVSDTINTQKHLRRVLPIYMIWCSIVDDLGHTSSVTTQDTRYVDSRYWPDRVSQSSEDWVHTFSSTTPGLGIESTSDNVWGYTLWREIGAQRKVAWWADPWRMRLWVSKIFIALIPWLDQRDTSNHGSCSHSIHLWL